MKKRMVNSKKCQLVWSNIPCENEAIGTIHVTIHSGIYSGVYELNNREVYYNICQLHFDKARIADDKEITFKKFE